MILTGNVYFPGIQRYRVLLVENGVAVVIALVLMAVVFAGTGYAIGPPTTTEEVRQNEVTVGASHDVEATITGETTVYQRGQTLENSGLYLSAAPKPTVTATADAPPGTSGTVTVRLVYSAATEDGTQVWSSRTVIAEQSLEKGVPASATVNASAIRDRVRSVQSEFGAAAKVRVQIVTTVKFTTAEHTGEVRVVSPFSFPSGSTYQLPASSASTTKYDTVTRQTTADSLMVSGTELGIRQVLLYALSLGTLFAALVSGVLRNRMDAEEESVRLAHHRHKEYITPVADTDPDPDYNAESLEALARHAINSGRQIFFDVDDTMYVVNGDVVSVYEPDSNVQVPHVDVTPAEDGDESEEEDGE